jgi:simple sugar transport system substrate-binding protein
VEFLFTDDATIPQIDANLDTAYLAHPSGLVFSMADFHSEAPILMHFVKENIPMVDINIPPEFGPALLGPVSEASMGIPYLTYIGSSEYLAGQDIGQAAVAAHVQGGVCLLTEAANSALLSRCSGMADTLKKAGLTTYKLITGLAPSTEESTIRDFLLAHTQRLALESMNSVEGPITAQIVQSLHSTDPVYSFDLGATVLQDIKNGTMAAAVDQQEYLQGFYAVEVLSFYLKYGFAPQTNILTGPLLITKANVGAPLKYFPLGVR